MPFLTPNQQRQSTEGYSRQYVIISILLMLNDFIENLLITKSDFQIYLSSSSSSFIVTRQG